MADAQGIEEIPERENHFSKYNESTESFDSMNLKAEILRGKFSTLMHVASPPISIRCL